MLGYLRCSKNTEAVVRTSISRLLAVKLCMALVLWLGLSAGLYAHGAADAYGWKNRGNGPASYLYSIDLATGRASIVGSDSTFGFNLFVVTPVPEPSAYAMMLGGFCFLTFIAGRRKRRTKVSPLYRR